MSGRAALTDSKIRESRTATSKIRHLLREDTPDPSTDLRHLGAITWTL